MKMRRLGYLLLILPVRSVQGLHQVGGVAEKHGVAGGTHHHTDHGEPHVTHALRRVGTVSNAQHVTHGHEQGVGVLNVPGCILGQLDKAWLIMQFQPFSLLLEPFRCDHVC